MPSKLSSSKGDEFAGMKCQLFYFLRTRGTLKSIQYNIIISLPTVNNCTKRFKLYTLTFQSIILYLDEYFNICNAYVEADQIFATVMNMNVTFL